MMKKGFTLAEVLITLGVIGVVAAMTMPTLIANQQKKIVSARLSKFYSVMSQVLIEAEREKGMIQDWGKPSQLYDQGGNYDPVANSNISDAFFKKYLAPYLKYVSAEKDPTFNNYTKVMFTDGSMMHVRNGGCYDIHYDVNGNKKPNVTGRDKYTFLICPTNNTVYFEPGVHFGTYAIRSVNTRTVAIAACKSDANFCGRMLQIDNWEVKDDYPRRI